MKFRKLRIAWSVTWGVLTVLLIILWANSNVSVDKFAVPVTQATYFKFVSVPNQFGIGFDDEAFTDGAICTHTPTDEWLHDYFADNGSPWSEEPSFFKEGGCVAVPYWFGVLIPATFTLAPLLFELRWRFSFRTLLIATTLLAVALGLIVCRR
jgi:hypothetical protein